MTRLRDGYFTSETPGGGARITSRSRRIAAAGIAATALGLALAVPARADDAAPAVPVPTAPADPAVAAPAVPGASATVVQSGATNVTVSIRIGSAGDSAGVTQTISSGSTTTALGAGAPPASSATTGGTAATAAQSAPANVAVSVRVASPGTDGAATQTIDASAAAATQYQPGATQYQPAPDPSQAAPTPSQTAPPSAPAPDPPPAAAPGPSAPALPTAWTWNWTWQCGDTTAAGITPVVDTGIQGWVWTWNLGGMCDAAAPTTANSGSIIPSQSSTDIPATAAPTVVPPEPPAAPVLPVIVAPTPPAPPDPPTLPVVAPVLVVGAPALAVEAVMPVDDLTPVEAPPVAQLTLPARDDLPRAQPPPVAPATPEAAALPAWRAFASVPAGATRETPSTPRDGSGEPHRARHLVVSVTDAPAGGGGAASGGGGGNGGPGGTAALAPWLLLSFLGYAALRLPASRRSPRAPVDEIDVRPG